MFERPFVGTAPDYSDSHYWLSLPENPHLPVDVIYLYPSACMTPTAPLVCDIDDPGLRDQGKKCLEQVRPIFEESANVFAPWWRQVSASSVMTLPFDKTDEAQWAEPRTDVFAAMDYYFENLNGGRPWIIAGHSQGSRMLGMVLGEYMSEHPDYYARMIAAYRVGDGMTRPYLAKYPHVKPAQSADDLGVCISYNTEGPQNIGHASLVVPPDCVAINPLNWRTDETPAGEELCLGCLHPDYLTSILHPVPEKVSTVLNLERGTVIVTNPEMQKYAISEGNPEFRDFTAQLFGPSSFHNCDYSFFFYNLKENVALRVKTWFEAHAS